MLSSGQISTLIFSGFKWKMMDLKRAVNSNFSIYHWLVLSVITFSGLYHVNFPCHWSSAILVQLLSRYQPSLMIHTVPDMPLSHIDLLSTASIIILLKLLRACCGPAWCCSAGLLLTTTKINNWLSTLELHVLKLFHMSIHGHKHAAISPDTRLSCIRASMYLSAACVVYLD